MLFMAKKSGKHYPTVTSMKLDRATPVSSATMLLQVDQVLSQVNRRLYRMGRYYKVKIDVDVTAADQYEVFALRDDWAVQKAFQMAYGQYLKNTADERASLGDTSVARWEDFRVEPGVSGNELNPVLHTVSLGSTRLVSGTFDLANVVDAQNIRRTFTWGTPSATQYGILQEYDKAGNAQLSPSSSPVGSAPYSDIDSEVNDLTHDDLQLDNREPPYDQTGVNATTPFVKIAELGSGALGQQRLSTGYFNAPCGIVIIVASQIGADASKLNLTVCDGDYKGVHAPSMLDGRKERSGFGSMGTWRNGVWTKD